MAEPTGVGLGRVVDHLGTTMLDLAAGEPAYGRPVTGLAVDDADDTGTGWRDAIVLGIATRGPDGVTDLVARAASAGAVAVVVRGPVADPAGLAERAGADGPVVLTLAPGASWTQFISLLQAMLVEGQFGHGEPEELGGVPAGDLFALANAIAALIDAPITIEDRSSRVLAFSGRQDEADQPRIQTILGRQVPEQLRRWLSDGGFFTELYRSDRPVFCPADRFDIPGQQRARVAVAVRAGDQILGSIWAAVTAPLTPAREQALVDAAKIVALHLMRLRAGADVARRLRADLVARALEGGADAPDAITRLRLAGRPAVVLALAPADADGDPPDSGAAELVRRQLDRERVADALSVHLSARWPDAAVAVLADRVYALVPVSADRSDPDLGVLRTAEDFLDRARRPAGDLVGLGRIATTVADLARSRTDADRAVRVLATRPSPGRVARLADVYHESLLLRVSDLVAADDARPAGVVSRLADYDAAHGGRLVETLSAWLDAFGDVGTAAAAVTVHPNTFRYRLRRITEVSGLDLTDPDQRFAAMLELRLTDQRTDRPAN